MAVFDCKLTGFCSSRKVTVEAYIDDDAVGKHDIIFERRFCAELGIIINYKTKTMIWDDLSVPMTKKKKNDLMVNTISDDPGDVDLPAFMKKATQRMSKGMVANAYDKHDYGDMIDRCGHLDEEKKNILKDLFSKFKELFSGKLGEVPGEKVKLTLKKDVVPFNSRPYSVPKAFEALAKKEV